MGLVSTITFFTKEGGEPFKLIQLQYLKVYVNILCTSLHCQTVPVDKPKNVKVDLINDTHVNVSWDPLTPHEAKGWPSYTVFIKRGMGSCTSILQPTGTSSVVIDNHDPASSYSVTVQVQTSVGTSDALKSKPG